MKKSFKITQPIKAVIIGIIVIVILYPLIFVIMASLKSNKEFLHNFWGFPRVFNIENYWVAWKVAGLGVCFTNSVIIVFSAIFFIILASLLAGYAFGRLKIPGGNLIFLILLATLMFPGGVTLIPLFILVKKLLLLNTRANLIVVYTAWAVTLSTYIFRNFFQNLPEELAQAARIDGCSEFQVFTKIMLPLALPAISSAVIIHLLFIWGEFLWALVSTTKESLKTLPLGLFVFQSHYNTNWGPLMAGLSIAIVPLLVVYFCLSRYFIRGLTLGALKE